MNAPQDSLAVPTAALRRLAEFLHTSGSPLKPADAASQAINEWIATARGEYPALKAAPVRGYQWKSVFLPEGTQLRMRFGDRSHYARVEGDAIVHDGRCVSPRQMTIAVGGNGHNAWRELAVLLPGETKWVPASRLRMEGAQQAPPRAASPAEAMTAAAACMTESLKTLLALVEHAKAQAVPHPERRAARHRRAQDIMEDDFKAD